MNMSYRILKWLGKKLLHITPIYVQLYQRVTNMESITYTIEKNRNFMIKFLVISNKCIIFVIR